MILIGRILQADSEAMEASTLVQQASSNAHTYLVSIPFFGYTDGQSKEYKVEATAATFPGVFFDYKKDDIVYLSFFQNDIDGAIILGKVLQTNLEGIVTIKADKIEANQITLVKEQSTTTLTTSIDGQNVKTTNIAAEEVMADRILINTNTVDEKGNPVQKNVLQTLDDLNQLISTFSASLNSLKNMLPSSQTEN